MKRETIRGIIALACVATSLGTTGCGAIFDVTYVLGSKHYDESKEERKPTGQVSTTIEYAGSVAPDGQMRLTCEERERRIERTFSVSKTYAYRGGFTRTTYVATTVLSGLAGGAIAGIIAIGCNLAPQPGAKDVKQIACINALFATPFALDVGYSLIRVATAKTPKLVDKHKSEGQLAFADVPTRSTAVGCDSIDRVVLGAVVGPGDLEGLNGGGSSEGQKLVDGSLPIMRDPDGSIKLISQPGVVNAWARNSTLGFWVVNREGKPRPIQVDRCGALRPTLMVMQSTEQSMFFQQCPLPNTTGQR